MSDINSKKKMNLRQTILSEENIYAAIYSMESYVFEKGLLSNGDVELYIRLHDKYDKDCITKVIDDCKATIERLLDNQDVLFDVSVYFKIKKWEEGKDGQPGSIKFRPIHTARLIDQICMVSMLLPLMYDDSGEKRKRSELTKIIPHNFFGNIPSIQVEMLFRPWIKQYKAYNETIIDHCKEYQQNHRYRTEITLDIQEFFPSISPEFIFNYVRKKLSFSDKEDDTTLKTVLTKLLFFNLNKDNLRGWEQAYYGDTVPDIQDVAMNRGIAQGLPQAYFFGNLCMIEISDRIKRLTHFNHCQAFYYVDDSVIYIEQPYDKVLFDATIKELNRSVESLGKPNGGMQPFESLDDSLNDTYRIFQASLGYTIKFHESGKSEFCSIDEAGTSIAGLEPLARCASMANSIYDNQDAIEDTYSSDKLGKIVDLIDDDIARIKRDLNNTEGNGNDNSSVKDNEAARLKLLKRYKRFYKYRLRCMEYRLKEEITDDDVECFYSHFGIVCKAGEVTLDDVNYADWFDTFDEDIFQSEAQKLIALLPEQKAVTFEGNLCKYERLLTAKFAGNSNALFFSRNFKTSVELKRHSSNPYSSVSLAIKRCFAPTRTLSSVKQHSLFLGFLQRLYEYREAVKSGNKQQNDYSEWILLLPQYVSVVFKNSDEFVRIILNAYYSVQNDIDVSDARSFVKFSSRGLCYTELRILARLRNKHFNVRQFIRAVEDIDAKNLDNRMTIDMGLLQVVNLFIRRVNNPDWIDNIILTHRVVKGLWYNGSKFMNSYTLHNEEHAVTLINSIVKLEKAIDYFSIKQTDYYILFLACYLHDISMVIHPNIRSFCNGDENSLGIISKFISEVNQRLEGNPDKTDNLERLTEQHFKEVGNFLVSQFEEIYKYFSNRIRKNHAKESADMIRSWNATVLQHLAPLLLSHVARISESHGYDSADVYGLKSEARCSLVSEKYMMMLIRLADLLDVANDRINYNLLRQNVTHMDPDSQFHWISHLITDEITVSPTFRAEGQTQQPINERYIVEMLNFNLCLNVKYITNVETKFCKNCRMERPLDRNIVTLLDDYGNYEGMMVKLFNYGNGYEATPSGEACPCTILCKWVMKKHEWLVKELIMLNKYLFSVNNHWFKTEIRLNILYRDDYNLDPDLYDSVQDYLQATESCELF